MTSKMFCLLLLLQVAAQSQTIRVPLPTEKEDPARTAWLSRLRLLPATTDHTLATFVPESEPYHTLRYYFYQPAASGPSAASLRPLVVVLHHAGAERRLTDMFASNPESIGRWLEPETQRRHPSFVLAPWSGGRHWENGDWKTVTPLTSQPSDNARHVLALIQKLVRDHPIDPDRIYLVGQSMGGFGTWDIIARRPDLFAAAIPVCGGGDPAQADRLKEMPIWTFRGDTDTVIPVERTRVMAKALEAATASRFRYWEYAGVGHDGCSERAFTEPELVDWLFSQRRAK